MGFQNAFNQLLATAAGGVVAGMHLHQQKIAQERSDWNRASGIVSETGVLRDQYNELKPEIKATEGKIKEAQQATDAAKEKYDAYNSVGEVPTRGEKAWKTRLNREYMAKQAALESYKAEYEKLKNRRTTIQERFNILGNEAINLPETVYDKLPTKTREVFDKGGKK